MTLRAVVSGNADAVVLDSAALDRLQWEQFQHDERYHREIARLTVQDRLKHMALHFAKYAGNLMENRNDEAKLKRIVTDIFIIATSSANVLNIRLANALPELIGADSPNAFARKIAILAGHMATACEKTDHLEDYPFRKVISQSVVSLAGEALAYCNVREWGIEEMVSTRLLPIKEKSIFHGQL